MGKLKLLILNLIRVILQILLIKFRVFSQRRKLSTKRSNIISKSDCSLRHDSNLWAVFVYYEPHGDISKSFINITKELNAAKINIIVVCNYEASEAQKEFITENAHTLLVRNNQGFDFGAYKDAIALLKQESPDSVERVYLLNDSIYYFKLGLKKFISEMRGPESVVAAFENWEPKHAYHLQSFALSVDKNVFFGKNFSKFWENYLPVSSRLYAIENGEKNLSKAILNDAVSLRVIYTIAELNSNVENFNNTSEFEFIVATPLAHRKGLTFALQTKSAPNFSENQSFIMSLKKTLLENINDASPIHYGMYYFAAIGCPMVKKDVVFRSVYEFWETEILLSKLYQKDEVQEFLGIIRRKGNSKSQGMYHRFLTFLGEK